MARAPRFLPCWSSVSTPDHTAAHEDEASSDETILELLDRASAAFASTLELEHIVQAVTDAGRELAGAEFGAFFYTSSEPDAELFRLYTLSGAPREAFARFGHPRNTPIFGPTFRGEGVIRLADVREDPRYGQWAPHHGMPPGHLPVCSYLAVPVVGRSGHVLGGLFFGHRERGRFTARSERLVTGLAAQAAIAIDHARLYEQARRDADERARLLEAERRARVELERVSLMKDEFLATLSHELRTPLNAVLGWADILLARGGEDPDARRGLETIARNARAQAQLIDDLLDMNRIVSGKLRLDVQRVDLGAVVEAALDSVRPSAQARGLHVRADVDRSLAPVWGDPNRLQQIVWNLLSNAVKFTPRGGHVDVSVRPVDGRAEVVVADDGAGIPPDFLPHVFERFRQADSSTTRKFGGLGLGLSIVKHLVELHGGTITADSAGRELGATFTITLPLRDAADLPPARERKAARTSTPADRPLAGATVLVVDDEADARDMLDTVLTGVGATVITAASAAEALAALASARPDIIVADIGMPTHDGYELMNDVRALPAAAGGRIPAIAVTAFARPEDRTRALTAGFQIHVSKPIEPQELIATIQIIVGRPGRAGTARD